MASSTSFSLSAGNLHNLITVVSVKLKASNYLIWRMQIFPLIQSLQLINHLIDDAPKSTILKESGTISEEALGHVVGMTTAREIKDLTTGATLATGHRKGGLYALEEGGALEALVAIKSGTPEQNGIAERKHRHIVETGLTMLLHAQLPKYLWVDAFTTAVYLINRLPSSVIQMQTPFYKLYGTHPTYASLKNKDSSSTSTSRVQSRTSLLGTPNHATCPVPSVAISPAAPVVVSPAPLLEQIPIVAAPVTAPADTSSPPTIVLPSQVVPPVLTSSDTSTASNIHTVPLDPQTVSPAPASLSTPHVDLVSSVATPASHGSATSTPPSSTLELYLDLDLPIAPMPHAPPISTNTHPMVTRKKARDQQLGLINSQLSKTLIPLMNQNL
uniref:Reverse transcriptase Ty1/copia-type domain-containing protein n=1 Tax=Fagus sylvatica TaxID=28930 RepID=A0A2N9F7M8_FAGSY